MQNLTDTLWKIQNLCLDIFPHTQAQAYNEYHVNMEIRPLAYLYLLFVDISLK
jgi:hypothetical protein